MPTQAEIREQITHRIVDALKAGTAPWRRPWSSLENGGSPANVVSRRPYSGVNTLLLELVAQERGYSSRWWGTFRQWQGLGLRVKVRPSHVNPGEWGTKIVFCKPLAKKPAHERDVEDQQGEAGEPRGRYLLLRQFTVFHAEQVEGEGVEKYLARPRSTATESASSPAGQPMTHEGGARMLAAGPRPDHSGSRAVGFLP
jgi:antirestriction protein ArdC